MSDRLVIAVPSKGRLEENASAFFARAGLPLRRGRGARDYRGTIGGVKQAEVAFLSTSEIVRELAAGNVHLGVTGEDLVQENIADPGATLERVSRLGFGYANVVVAVPRAWIDVATMSDLDDVAHLFRAEHGSRLRVATKYVNLTRRHFSAHGVADYRMVESLGATEGAPAAGTAEIIVDITTTGATLAANDLKILDNGTILRSEAALFAGLQARWSGPVRTALEQILDLVAAEARAREAAELTVFGDADASRAFGAAIAEAPDVEMLGAAAGATMLLVPRDRIQAVSRALRHAGASAVLARRPDYVFEAANDMLARVMSRIEDAPQT